MSGALAPAAMGGLDKATQETVVTQYLTTARERLSLALEATGPQAVATLRAEIATAAEATKQLGLSKEIQLDAQEMVRRAEYALGKAIRKGQAEGKILGRGQILSANGGFNEDRRDTKNFGKASPDEFLPNGQERHEVYVIADNASEEEFEQALAETRDEGNLSRANVVRKVKANAFTGKTADDVAARVDAIRDLASQGYTSRQISDRIHMHPATVRRKARENDIDIAADRLIGKSARAIDSTRIAQETVSALEGLALGLRLFDPDNADPAQADEWATSLNDSLRALNRFRKQIKEMTL